MAKNKKEEMQSYEEFKVEVLEKEKENVEARGKEFKENDHAYKAARDYIRKYLFDNEELMEVLADMGTAIKEFVGTGARSSAAGPRAPRVPALHSVVKDAFLNEKSLTESDIFMLTMEHGNAWGRKAVRDFIKKMVNLPEEDRLWIDFVAGDSEDGNMGTYYLLAQGPDAPEGWEGPTPKEAINEIDV